MELNKKIQTCFGGFFAAIMLKHLHGDNQMKEIENPKEFAEWLRDVAQHIEDGSPLIKSVMTGTEAPSSDCTTKIIEIKFRRPDS